MVIELPFEGGCLEEPDVEALVTMAEERFGGLDIMFNNAGVGGAIGPLTDTEVDSWDYTMDVLAKGVFLVLSMQPV